MPFKLKMPKIRGRRQKEKSEEPRRKPDEWEILCNDPKYYTNLPEEEKEKISEIQQGLYHDLVRLPFEIVLNERRTMTELIREAEKQKNQENYDEAANLYRKAATLGLLRKEIREKINPNASDVKLEDAVAYLKLAVELGYPLPYDSVINYPKIVRAIASDKLSSYQLPELERKIETEEITESLKK